MLKQLYSDYDKLLFFHIPKMLRMSKLLHHGNSMLEGIPLLVWEISFLFDSTKETRQHIEAALLQEVCTCVHACMRSCVHACVCACISVCVCEGVHRYRLSMCVSAICVMYCV